jgi:hypothetical protein
MGIIFSLKEFIEDARKMANQFALFLAKRNAKKRTARKAKRTQKGPSSSKATDIGS